MKKVIDRARDTRKTERKVEIQDVFDLSMAAELDAALKKRDGNRSWTLIGIWLISLWRIDKTKEPQL